LDKAINIIRSAKIVDFKLKSLPIPSQEEKFMDSSEFEREIFNSRLTFLTKKLVQNNFENSDPVQDAPESKKSDVNWYDVDRIETLLRFYLADNANVFIPSHNQLGHEVIIDNIDSVVNRIKTDSNTIGILPIQVNGNHWVGMTIRLVGEQYEVVFVDSFGYDLSHYDTNNIISRVLDILLPNNYILVSATSVQQLNSYDCGPITVDNLQRIAHYAIDNPNDFITAERLSAHILNSNFDSESLRTEHNQYINSMTIVETRADEVGISDNLPLLETPHNASFIGETDSSALQAIQPIVSSVICNDFSSF
jgi:hypothetical protein